MICYDNCNNLMVWREVIMFVEIEMENNYSNNKWW